MIRSIFFDMDGTLVASATKKVPPSAKKAIRELQSRGIRVIAATGRHPMEMASEDLQDIAFDGVAALNGQFCYTPQKVLLRRCLPPEDLEAFCAYIKKHPFPCSMEEEDRFFINEESEAFLAALKSYGLPLPPVDSIEGLEKREILQIVAFCSEDTLKDLIKTMPHAAYLRWSPEFADIAPKEGGKTQGIAAFLEHFSILPEETMAFGDGENDIEMLKAVSIGVAMGNAAPKLKEVAHWVTASADDDGVALGLKHFGLLP